jgi:hypothetical protein
VIVNPFGKEHGAPSDQNRHVGDLGNIKTDGQGNSRGSITDRLVKLIGAESVIGVSSIQPLTSLLSKNISSEPSLSMPALMTSARPIIQIPRKLATLEAAQLAVSHLIYVQR